MNTADPTALAQRWLDNTDPNTYGFGRCMCCMDSWAFKEWHATNFTDREGASPLCVDCWAMFEPADRLRFYEALLIVWERQSTDERQRNGIAELRPQIHAAVMAGK